MNNKKDYEYLLSDLTKLRGVGIKIANLLRKKKKLTGMRMDQMKLYFI